MTGNQEWMTVREVADYLRVSSDLIYRLSQEGKIPASRVGGRWRFNREKINEWMEGNQSSLGTRKGGHTVQAEEQ